VNPTVKGFTIYNSAVAEAAGEWVEPCPFSKRNYMECFEDVLRSWEKTGKQLSCTEQNLSSQPFHGELIQSNAWRIKSRARGFDGEMTGVQDQDFFRGLIWALSLFELKTAWGNQKIVLCPPEVLFNKLVSIFCNY
jgi:hypothetical protein